jgi:phosphoglycolate phosphatase
VSVRLAVFDCDGTLVDGQAAVCQAMAAAFAEAGLPAPEPHAIRRIVGLSLPAAIRRLVPDLDDPQALVDGYKRAFFAARSAGQVHEPLFPGIRPLLDSLRARGWILGVATGKSDRGLKNCLSVHGLSDHFATLQTADRHPSKPHPSMLIEAMDDALARPADTVMIGDTVFDIEMAVAAGTRAIGVAWGYHAAEELRAAGAEAVAMHAGELEEWLR